METEKYTNTIHLGRKIERVRRLRGMTQAELGDLLGITKQAVSKIEQTEKFDDERLGEIASALGVTVDGLKNFNEETILYNTNNFYENCGVKSAVSNTGNNQTFNSFPVEYFFLTPEEFRCRIENNEFLEYEEVYKDRYYGTLKAQVEKQLEAGQNVVFDVDVVGGCNIKKFYGDRALSVFIQPPSVEELRCRLEGRGTDAPEIIESRIAKAEYELGFAPQFDCVIVNDDLEAAKAEALKVIKEFLAEE